MKLDELIAQLDTYVQQTQVQLDASPDQAPYWRGVLFGLELAVPEVRKRQVPMTTDEPVMVNAGQWGTWRSPFPRTR